MRLIPTKIINNLEVSKPPKKFKEDQVCIKQRNLLMLKKLGRHG